MQKLPKAFLPMAYMVFILTIIDTYMTYHKFRELEDEIHESNRINWSTQKFLREDIEDLQDKLSIHEDHKLYDTMHRIPDNTEGQLGLGNTIDTGYSHMLTDTVAWKPKIFYRYHKKWHTKPKKVLYTTGPCMGTDPWYLSQDTLYSMGIIKGGITPTKVQFGNTYALTGDATWSRIDNIKPNPYWRVCNYDDSLIASNTWSSYIRHQMPWLPGGGNLISRVLRRIPEDSIKTWIGRKTYDSLLLPSIETDLK